MNIKMDAIWDFGPNKGCITVCVCVYNINAALHKHGPFVCVRVYNSILHYSYQERNVKLDNIFWVNVANMYTHLLFSMGL